MKHAHIIGAGLAGISAALELANTGYRVRLYESGPQAGGRCRSYFDKYLDCLVDNGNHLLLSGNHAAMRFLDMVGGRQHLTGPHKPEFPFTDLQSGERWVVRPNLGKLPWWLFAKDRQVPGAKLSEFLPLLNMHKAPPSATVDQWLKPGELKRRLLDPLAIAALNTMPDQGSARLLGAVVKETLAEGGAACIPLWPHHGLSTAFIDPALARLQLQGGRLLFGHRISVIEQQQGRVTSLTGPEGPIGLEPDDVVILATTAPVAASLLPGLSVPDQFEAILNIHYRAEAPSGFVGLINSTAEWAFAKQGHVSVTISAGNRYVDEDPEQLATRVWPEVCAALQFGARAMPEWRVVKEKRATFAATPQQEARRPGAYVGLANLALAGDYTATGLPATIEGAIRSGCTAAKLVMKPRHA
jgi:hydroxysqualene dehydroxylase